MGKRQDSCENMSDGRKTVFDFCLEGSVGEKGFNIFYDFNRIIEGGHFVEKTFVPNAVEGFLHVDNHRSGLYVIMVFAEFMCKISQEKCGGVFGSEGKSFGFDFCV